MEILRSEFKRPKTVKEQSAFYKKYAGQLFRTAYRYVSSEDDAGDIVNKAFYSIFQNMNTYIHANENGLLGWMNKITINEALMFLRKQANNHEEYIESIHYQKIESESEMRLSAEDYYKLIKQLPLELRTVFNLYAIDGYSHKEIADKLSISESSSRVYLSRARKILQEKIKNE